MYARKARIQIPEIGKPIGFDLMVGDWVAPYGAGVRSDFIFLATRRWASRSDFDCTIKLSFQNTSDGLVPISTPIDQGSELRLSAIAPEAEYKADISKDLSHTPSKGWHKDENREQNYYFRVRTVLDDEGAVKSALYGKIYDDFVLDPINSKTTWILFTYYLNPVPNSRNVEFDPHEDLFRNLPDQEQVSAP
jgi:hypothetical protein